jgi:Ankyrin repeats (3 copies)
MPPLFPAVRSNHQDAIRYLIEVGADPNAHHDLPDRGDFFGTALHWAARSVYTDNTSPGTVELLIELGADPTVRDRLGECALDSIYRAEHESHETLLPILALLSSRPAWTAASWKLNESKQSSFQPARRGGKPGHTWNGIEFREGDRVRVYRRYNGFYREPEDTGHSRSLLLRPGLTGTIHTFVPGGGGDWKRFQMVVNFDAGEWEEAENFGKVVRLGPVRTRLTPELAEHFVPEPSVKRSGLMGWLRGGR